MRQAIIRNHTLSVAATLLFVGTPVLAISALSAGTAQAAAAPSMSVKPASAYPGDSVTVSWEKFTKGCSVQIALDGSVLGKGEGPSGSVAVTVPASAKPSTGHLFTVTQSAAARTKCTAIVVRAPFTVLQPPPPPTTKPTPTKPPSTTTPPGTTTEPPATVPPGTTTTPTSPGATGPTTAPTGSPTPGSTDPAGLTPSGGAGSSPTAEGGLRLDRQVVVPGDPLTASGQGCPPGATVRLSAGVEPAGTATAGSDGAFSASVRLSHVSPGRVIISADCGVLLTSGVDQVVTTSSPLAQTRVLLVFVVLIGFLVLRWQVGSAIRRRQ